MKAQSLFVALLTLLFLCAASQLARAQSETTPVEVGIHFSQINLARVFGPTAEPGVGGRITFNPARFLSLEGEFNFFPKEHNNSASNQDGGRVTQGLFGVKSGWRTARFGLFGKARPGFLSYGRAITGTTGSANPLDFTYGRLTHLAFDLGGVAEFYMSKRLIWRIDLGDTMVRQGSQSRGNPPTIVIPASIKHNLQFSTGVGLRF